MREYSRFEPGFWTGATGRQLRGHKEAIIVAAYVINNDHANMTGLYFLPIMYIAHETGLTLKEASKGLRRVIEVGFARYDEASERIWVINMARKQIGDRLKPNDNQRKGLLGALRNLRNHPFLKDFCDYYRDAFGLPNDIIEESPYEGASKALRSQDQDQDQDQAQEQEQAQASSTDVADPVAATAAWCAETWNTERHSRGLDHWPAAGKLGRKSLGHLRSRIADADNIDAFRLVFAERVRQAAGAYAEPIGEKRWRPDLPWLLEPNGWEKASRYDDPGPPFDPDAELPPEMRACVERSRQRVEADEGPAAPIPPHLASKLEAMIAGVGNGSIFDQYEREQEAERLRGTA